MRDALCGDRKGEGIRFRGSWAIAAGVFAIYFAAAKLGYIYASTTLGVSPIWPAAGFALAATLLLGYRILPFVFAAALLTHLTVPLSVLCSVVIALGNALQAYVGAFLIQRFIGTINFLDRPAHILKFVFWGVLCSSFVSATIGLFILCAAGEVEWGRFAGLWNIWWLGDIFGILVITPFVMAWTRKPVKFKCRLAAEGVVIFLIFSAGMAVIFSDWLPERFLSYHLEHLALPVLLLAAYRFGQKGATASILVLTIFSTWGTVNGHGPFFTGISIESIHLLQLSVVMCSLTVLILSAVRLQHSHSEVALRNSETLYQSTVENLPLHIFRKDVEGRFVFVNNILAKRLGVSQREIVGKTDFDFHSKDAAEKYRNDDAKVLNAGTTLAFIEEHNPKARASIDIEVVKAPVREASGKIVGILGAFWDVTERLHAESLLKEAKQAADLANRAKSEFIANMSHEIRTPLSAILGFVEMMEDPSQTELDRYRSIGRIRRNVRNLTALIDDILDISKVEAGKLQIEKLSFGLLQELGDIYSLMRQQAEAKNLYFRFNFNGQIPSTVITDPTRLRQILINIVGNAIKFTKQGGVSVTVKANSIPKGTIDRVTLLEFIVSDTGCGISKAQSTTLFQPFVQADSSTTRKYGGTGLGLVLSRRLALALGGDVVLVDSVVGEGSTFKVSLGGGRLPGVVWEENLTEAHLIQQVPTHFVPRRKQLSRMEVLLAEDGPDNQELISHFLGDSGASVEIAQNGVQAVRLAMDKRYDVILMDIQMPVLDGYEATRQLREKGYTGPIVALSARAMIEEKQKCFQVGCDGFISKPVSRDHLIQTIKTFYRRGRMAVAPNEWVYGGQDHSFEKPQTPV